jgi:hypothetical protein
VKLQLAETETVSFSLTMGTTPMDNSSEKVFCALRYRVLYPRQSVGEKDGSG